MTAIWIRFWPHILAAGAVFATLLGLYTKGRQAGKAAEIARQTAKVIKASEVRRNVDQDIRSGKHGPAVDRLRSDWSRD
jgi:hypothetical protein